MTVQESLNRLVEKSIANYEADLVAQAAIRALEKAIHEKGRRDTSYWAGIYQVKNGEIQLVEVQMGIDSISVLRTPDPLDETVLRLLEEGKVITLPQKKG